MRAILMATASAVAISSALPAAAQMTSIGPGEGQVNIVAWAGYVESGKTDPAYDWVTAFTEKTGCVVNVKTAATSDEMVALMNEGGFDLVTASGDAGSIVSLVVRVSCIPFRASTRRGPGPP